MGFSIAVIIGPRCLTVGALGGDDRFMDADPRTVYLLETAKDWLPRDIPGYSISDVDFFLNGVLVAVRSGAPPSPADVRAVTFPLTTLRTGYVPRDVDRLIGELAQMVRRPGSDADVPPGVRKVVDRIKSSRLSTTRRGGYEAEEVDKFLQRIMHSLVEGERGSLRQLAGEARFPTGKLRPEYVKAEVDSLLASLEQALADLA
jgi:DivIVA domain-containing protein